MIENFVGVMDIDKAPTSSAEMQARMLARYIHFLSRESYGEDWHSLIEYDLWFQSTQPYDAVRGSRWTVTDLGAVFFLGGACGGWVTYDPDEERGVNLRYVPMQEWMRHLVLWQQGRANR